MACTRLRVPRGLSHDHAGVASVGRPAGFRSARSGSDSSLHIPMLITQLIGAPADDPSRRHEWHPTAIHSFHIQIDRLVRARDQSDLSGWRRSGRRALRARRGPTSGESPRGAARWPPRRSICLYGERSGLSAKMVLDGAL